MDAKGKVKTKPTTKPDAKPSTNKPPVEPTNKPKPKNDGTKGDGKKGSGSGETKKREMSWDTVNKKVEKYMHKIRQSKDKIDQMTVSEIEAGRAVAKTAEEMDTVLWKAKNNNIITRKNFNIEKRRKAELKEQNALKDKKSSGSGTTSKVAQDFSKVDKKAEMWLMKLRLTNTELAKTTEETYKTNRATAKTVEEAELVLASRKAIYNQDVRNANLAQREAKARESVLSSLYKEEWLVGQHVKGESQKVTEYRKALTTLKAQVEANQANGAQAKQQLWTLKQEYKQHKNIEKSQAKQNFLQQRITSSSKQWLGTMVSAYAVMAGVKGVVKVGQDFESVRNTMTAVSETTEQAGENFKFVQGEAYRLGLGLKESAKGFAKMISARGDLSIEETKKAFTGISEMSTLLGLSAEESSRAINALQQMMSKGVVSSEELNFWLYS